MNPNKPVIGVTGPAEGGTGAWIFTAISVIFAGGRPLRIIPQDPRSINGINGLVIGGGADIEPMRYGQQKLTNTPLDKDELSIPEWIFSLLLLPLYWLARYFQHTKKSPVDPDRDELEFKLLQEATSRSLPILGICRGMQLMNVHFKGTLHQDIREFYGEKAQISSIFPRKRVAIEDDTLLYSILHTPVCKVNALHHQAIDRIGNNIRVSAREVHTGVIQAIEHQQHEFIIGVQWHPEYLIQILRQRRLFKRLVAAASSPSASDKPTDN